MATTERYRSKSTSMKKGGVTTTNNDDITSGISTMDFLNRGNLTPEERNFIFRNTLETKNPVTGDTQSYGKLFDFLRSPSNRGDVDRFLKKEGRQRGLHNLPRSEAVNRMLEESFNSSKKNFYDIAKKNPQDIVIPSGVVSEIYRNRPEFKNPTESPSDDKLSEILGFFPEEIETFEPTPDRPAPMPNPQGFEKGGKMFMGGSMAAAPKGGGFGNFLSGNADLIGSGAQTISNLIQSNKIETEATPVLARHKRSPFKSTLEETTRMNNANFQGFLDSLNSTGGGSNAVRSAGLANVMESNTKASIADQNAENQFNVAQDRLGAGVNLANTQTQNQFNDRNLTRRNEKLASTTSAINSGFQDVLNVLSNRQVQNMQSKELTVEALKSVDSGVLERIAESLGLDVQGLLDRLGDPNKTLSLN